MSQNQEVDPALLGEFIDESLEHLAQIPELFIKIEADPDNVEIVNRIFRPVHTIKGSSSFFGLVRLQKLAHASENVMDMLRKRQLRPSRGLIDVILESVEAMMGLFERVRNGQAEVENMELYEKLLAKVQNLAQQEEVEKEAAFRELEAILARLSEHTLGPEDAPEIAHARGLLSTLVTKKAEEPKVQELPAALAKLLRSIFDLLALPAGESEEKIRPLRELLVELQKSASTEELRALIILAVEDYDAMMPLLGFDALLKDVLIDRMNKAKKMFEAMPVKKDSPTSVGASNAVSVGLSASAEASEASSTAGSSAQPKAEGEQHGLKVQKTMRVPESAIDNFLNFVGELIIIRSRFDHLRQGFISNRDKNTILDEFRKLMASFGELSNELERSIMGIRRVPVRAVFQKIPKIVRDIAATNGKKIEIRMEGEDIEVDKSLMDSIEGPLVHMIRNSADHGLEPEAERLSAGKNPVGILSVSLVDMEDFVRLTVRDDGRGLPLDKLKKKAVSMNLIAENAELTEKDIIDLVFLPGVSTAEKVTDVSGRGVGMDVVRQNIQAAGGKIAVETKSGLGSTFTIDLPKSVTTQIINGFIVEVGGKYFALPVKNIQETYKPKPEYFTATASTGECVTRGDETHLLVRMSEFFDGRGRSERNTDKGYILVIEDKGERMALLADDILGIRQVVIKPIGDICSSESVLFTGAAILGDGRMALAVDIENLYRNSVAGSGRGKVFET